MEATPPRAQQGLGRRVHLGWAFLLVSLSPALLQPLSCEVGGPDLEALAIEAGGISRLVGFSPSIRSYQACVPEGTEQVVVRAQAQMRSARVYYGARPGSPEVLAYDGEGSVETPGGSGQVHVEVYAGGRFARYTVHVDTGCSGSWGATERIESNDWGRVDAPQVVTDAAGNVSVVWVQHHFVLAPTDIWSNRYTPGEGWGVGERVELDDTADARNPQLAVDGNGVVTAVWARGRATTGFSVWSNRYSGATGWGEPERLDAALPAGTSAIVDVAANAAGDVFAVWSQDETGSGSKHIYARQYSPGTGWGAVAPVEDSADNVFSPAVVVDSDGRAIVTWVESNATTWSVWVNRYSPIGGWEEPQQLSGPQPVVVGRAELVFDSTGTATAVWYETTVGAVRDSTMWASRHSPASGWSSPQVIDGNTSAQPGAYQIDVDAAGNVSVVWPEIGEDDQYSIWFNRYTQSEGWGDADTLASSSDRLSSARLAVDSEGSATAVYGRTVGIYTSLWSTTSEAGGPWGPDELVETDDIEDALNPRLSVGLDGVVTAVFTQYDGTHVSLFANRTQ